MKISELILKLDGTIQESIHFEQTGAGVRTCRILKEVIFYLIEKGDLNMNDNHKEFFMFVTRFSASELYKVAEYYRKTKGNQPLNFQQNQYHLS